MVDSIPNLVGFGGYARSGKDEAAKALQALGFERRSFADKLKAVATDIGWDGKKDDKGRKLLQDLGMAVRTHIDPDAWVKAAMGDLPRRCVFTDVRFPNEAKAIREAGGVLLRIHRKGIRPVNGHESETALDDFDWDGHIFNDYDLTRFHYTVVTSLYVPERV